MATRFYKGNKPLLSQPYIGGGLMGRAYVGGQLAYGEAAKFLPSYTPYAFYDATNPDSYDATNKTWSDVALVNTTDDSTFDTSIGAGDLPTWNSNGYWEIRSNTSTNVGDAFKYGTTTNTTNPFSFITDTSHTILTYVRFVSGDTDNDVVGSGAASGAVLMGGYGTGVPTRGHVWATSVQTVDTPTGLGATNWGVVGQKYRLDGSNTRVSSFYVPYNGTAVIANDGTFTPGTPTSSPNKLGIGTRGYNNVRGNF